MTARPLASRLGLFVLLALSAHTTTHAQSRLRWLSASTPTVCVGTAVTTSDTWQTLSSAAANGTTFCIAAGTHRFQSVQPKQDQKFIGTTGSIMSGASILIGASGTGPWTYSGQTQAGTDPGVVCLSTQPMCIHPEDVFIDDVRQLHVTTLAQVTVGTPRWFFDYAADTITIGTNPAGRLVETSVTNSAFLDEGGIVTGVRIEGLTIEKYANPGQKGAIQAPNGQSWIVTNNVLRWNHGTAIAVGSNGTVTTNYAHHNGQNGIGAYDATGLTISGNEAAFNGDLFDPYWGAGGMKVAFVRSSTITANNVHDNFGPGIWCDIDCNLVTISGNQSNDNQQTGIFYEISFNGTITGNTVRRNGLTLGAVPAAAGILIAESAGVVVSGNTVEDNGWGIYGYQQARGSSTLFPGVLWQIRDLDVNSNIVKVPLNGRVGLEQAESDNTYFTTKNNHFENNTYTLQTNLNKFTWNNLNDQPFAGANWQGAGHDTPTGSAVTYP